jgi:toxin ParE1/3/4
MRVLFIRARADADARRAMQFYAEQADTDLALHFVERLQRTYSAIAAAPDTGSPRWAHDLGIAGLRAMRLRGFPWLVFYIVVDNRIEILRVLDARSDIPAWMGETPDA